MNESVLEQLCAETDHFVSDVDKQIDLLNEKFTNVGKYMKDKKDDLQLLNKLKSQMDSVFASYLQLGTKENDNIKEAVEAAIKQRKEEVDLLKITLNANTAVKNERKQQLKEMKEYVDGLKRKQTQLIADSVNETMKEERFLMRNMGIKFKVSKDDSVIAVIYKNSNSEKVEKLISVEQENRDEVRNNFWNCLNKTCDNSAPTKKYEEVSSNVEQIATN